MKCSNSSFMYYYFTYYKLILVIYTSAEITLLGVWEFTSTLIATACYVLVMMHTSLIIHAVYYMCYILVTVRASSSIM